jgi:molecular chaperone GrpE
MEDTKNNQQQTKSQTEDNTLEEVHESSQTMNEAPEEVNAEGAPSKEDQLVKEVAELKDKYLRLHADFENARKRYARERIELFQNANGEMMKALLPVVDDFERALAHENNAAANEGLMLIYTKLKRTLEQNGLKPMEALHQTFDTEFHEAITNIPAPSEDLKGKVVDVVEKGYFINEQVLRYAKVVVGQ